VPERTIASRLAASRSRLQVRLGHLRPAGSVALDVSVDE